MKIYRILEVIWLALACIGLLMCVYNIISKDNQGAIYFLVFTLVSGLMYALRKRQRIKYEQAQEKKKTS